MRIFIENNDRPEILDRVEARGFTVFDSEHDYDLNIIGERNPNGEADKFDDWINVIYREHGNWQWHIYRCTTDAGMHYLKNYSLPSGTAILCHPQQMKSVYGIDLHKGRYEALCQRNGTVKVWRDRDRDPVHDMMGDIDEGYFGINIHKAGRESVIVGKWSAGCTVFANSDDFEEFMGLCREQVRRNGWKFFTYTLILGK